MYFLKHDKETDNLLLQVLIGMTYFAYIEILKYILENKII